MLMTSSLSSLFATTLKFNPFCKTDNWFSVNLIASKLTTRRLCSTRRKLVSEKGEGSNVDWKSWKHKPQPRTRRNYEIMAVVSISSSTPNQFLQPLTNILLRYCVFFFLFTIFIWHSVRSTQFYATDHVSYNSLFMSKCVK